MGGNPEGGWLLRDQLMNDLGPDCSGLLVFHGGRVIHLPFGFPPMPLALSSTLASVCWTLEHDTREKARPGVWYSTHLRGVENHRGNESNDHHERRAAHCTRDPDRPPTAHEGGTCHSDPHPFPSPQRRGRRGFCVIFFLAFVFPLRCGSLVLQTKSLTGSTAPTRRKGTLCAIHDLAYECLQSGAPFSPSAGR